MTLALGGIYASYAKFSQEGQELFSMGGTFANDEWAIISIAMTMIFGVGRAFAQPGAVENLFATIHQEPDPLPSIRADVPDALALVIRRCLAKTPEDRFASTRDLVAALEAAGNELTKVPAKGSKQ